MINVPDPFTLSVVYMTTDAMPSNGVGRTPAGLPPTGPPDGLPGETVGPAM
jgi:hypothetical protein